MTVPAIFSCGAKITRSIRGLLIFGLQVLLFITLICIFVPFSPAMPGEGLDPSWVFGMNQAVAQGFAFGRDLIFTFGPYASIYTKTFHPATDHLMMVGSLYLGLSYWIAVFLLTRSSRWYLLSALWVILVGLLYSRDALFYSYPLLVGLFCYQSVNPHDKIELNSNFVLILTTILFFPFGLYPLIKGSFLILCGAIAILSATFFVINRRWKEAIIIVVSPITSILFFWILSGQSYFDFPSYFVSMSSIISGYTEAMAINGIDREIILYLFAAFFLLIAILQADRVAIKSRIFISLIFTVHLFLAFKGGFVRHDAHAIMSGESILIASLFFAIAFHSRQTPVVLFVSVFAWMYIDSHYSKTSTDSIFRNIKSTYSSAWNGFNNRFSKKEWLEDEFEKSIKRLSNKENFPLFSGNTDIYSYNQSYLIASGNIWNPRPILQSYSTYTSFLSLTNKKHLLGEKAPDSVLFRVESIDGRIPSIEDGASWPTLLTHYQPSALENNYLYLHKKPSTGNIPDESLIGKGSYSFGDAVSIPNDSAPIFAEISIKQSPIGKLANIFYKPSQLQISLTLENGTTKTYRIISGMAKSGFLISPLVENTTEFNLLYSGMEFLLDKKVKSFFVAPVGGKRQWNNTYEVTFKKIKIPARIRIDVSKLFKLDTALHVPGNLNISVAEKCVGSIDFVNGFSPDRAQFPASDLLYVHGWLAKQIDQIVPLDAVLLVLSGSKGNNIFFNTRKTLRPDVGAYFKNTTLDSSGYASTVDVSAIRGDYTLSLAYIEDNHINLCPQTKIHGNFKGIL